MKFFKTFINWLFPYRCISCMSEVSDEAIICPRCFSKIVFIEHPICKICGKMLDVSNIEEMLCETCKTYPRKFTLCRSLFLYNHQAKNIIMKIKNQASSNIAHTCAKMIINKNYDIFSKADIVIPIPSHWTRIIKRGHNPAAIISKELAKILQKQHAENYLKKIRKTGYQKKKSIEERQNNICNAFFCNKDLTNKSVILVDDVLTTGATLNEAAQILTNAGAQNILAITIGTTQAFSCGQKKFSD